MLIDFLRRIIANVVKKNDERKRNRRNRNIANVDKALSRLKRKSEDDIPYMQRDGQAINQFFGQHLSPSLIIIGYGCTAPLMYDASEYDGRFGRQQQISEDDNNESRGMEIIMDLLENDVIEEELRQQIYKYLLYCWLP